VPALAAQADHLQDRRPSSAPPSGPGWRTISPSRSIPCSRPLAIDQSHPFPEIGNKTLNVIVSLDNPDTPDQESHTAILPVPRILPRLVQMSPTGPGRRRFIFLSEIIKLCAGELFPGYRVNSAHAFRVTRNSDLYIDDEEAENLLKRIEEELRNLRRGAAVRLEIEAGVPTTAVFTLLCEHLQRSRRIRLQARRAAQSRAHDEPVPTSSTGPT
jgi:polyphosphate kinase